MSADIENLEATFRVEGKKPEVWHPETGVIEEVSYNIAEGHTTVPLKMEPNDALFVVFRKKTTTSSFSLMQPVETQLSVIDNAWKVLQRKVNDYFLNKSSRTINTPALFPFLLSERNMTSMTTKSA